MKNKKVFKFISIKILVIFLIFSVILLCIKILKNSKDFSGFQEDIIFFKLFDISEKSFLPFSDAANICA